MAKKNSAYNITILSMFTAITIILMYTPLGTIPVLGNTVSIFYIPVIISTLVLGLKEGLVMGFITGVISLSRAIISPLSPLDPFFINPLVSIPPRMLISVASYFVYKLLSIKISSKLKLPEVISVGVSVLLGSLTNTFGTYAALYIIYARKVMEVFDGKDFLTIVIGLISLTTLFKAVIVVIITTPIVINLNKYLKVKN